jgi:heme/copper-type cytochrome/quinol oxidase subunit 1
VLMTCRYDVRVLNVVFCVLLRLRGRGDRGLVMLVQAVKDSVGCISVRFINRLYVYIGVCHIFLMPFFVVVPIISMVSSIVPKECVALRTLCANLELSWLYRIGLLLTLNPALNVRPVCPMYILLQVLHFSLYTPDLL